MITCSMEKPIPKDALKALMTQVHWAKNRTDRDIQHMLTHSVNFGAWDSDTLVGYARVLCDGRFRALIEDVVVDESRRGEGIGRILIEHIVTHLSDHEQILLLCEDHNITFYEQFGFEVIGHNCMQIWRGN